METLKKQKILVETLKKRTNNGGDVKETDKVERQRNRQIFQWRR